MAGAVARRVEDLEGAPPDLADVAVVERTQALYDLSGIAVRKLTDATVKVETSLAWLNIGQSLITNLMMAGAMIFTAARRSRFRWRAR